jgi:phage terminase small subunit
MKQRKMVHKWIETGNLTEATQFAYNTTKHNASRIGNRIMKSENVKNYIREVLTAAGLTPESIAKDLQELRKNTKPEGRVSDPSLHLRTIQEGAKLLEMYPIEKKSIEKKVAKFDISLKGKNRDELIDELEKQQEEFTHFMRAIKRKKDS